MPSSGGIFHRKCLKATAGFRRKHRLTKIKMKEPQARITRPPTHLFFMTHSCPNLYCKEKSTTRRISDLCSTPRWTKRLRGVLTHAHTNGKHRFVLTTYYTTKIFMNVSCSKVRPSSKSTHTPPATASMWGRWEYPSKLPALGLRGGTSGKPPVFHYQDSS